MTRKAMTDQRVLELLRYGWLDGLDGAPMAAHLRADKRGIDEALQALEDSGLEQADEKSIALALQAAANQGALYRFTPEQLAAASPYDRGQMLLLQGDPDVLKVFG